MVTAFSLFVPKQNAFVPSDFEQSFFVNFVFEETFAIHIVLYTILIWYNARVVLARVEFKLFVLFNGVKTSFE